MRTLPYQCLINNFSVEVLSLHGCSENAECGVRSAECGVRSAECGVRSAECGVRSAECGVRSAECGVQSAESKKKIKNLQIKKKSK